MILAGKYEVSIEKSFFVTDKTGKTLIIMLIDEMGKNKGIAIDTTTNNQIVITPIRIDGKDLKMDIVGKIIKNPTNEKIAKEIESLIKNPAKNF